MASGAKRVSNFERHARKPGNAGVVQWQNGSFPSCIRGFDSFRPLHPASRHSFTAAFGMGARTAWTVPAASKATQLIGQRKSPATGLATKGTLPHWRTRDGKCLQYGS